MKNLPIMACTLLVILLLVGLAGAGITALGMQDNGQEIWVKVGEVIELALEEQGGTGYLWEFHRLNPKYFEVVGTETRPLADQPRMGGPILKIWRLKTKEPGDAKLSLDYFRPWEGRTTAVKHYEVKVRIQ